MESFDASQGSPPKWARCQVLMGKVFSYLDLFVSSVLLQRLKYSKKLSGWDQVFVNSDKNIRASRIVNKLILMEIKNYRDQDEQQMGIGR